jgi:predicted glycoside hydrolase/deacetylase ChbG (UPF0249 family)
MTDRCLIVSADDFGLTPGVDRGIMTAVAAGAVTSVGVIANLAEPAAVARLAAAGVQPSIGVHLNLTTGRPVLPPQQVPSLVDGQGAFRPLAALTRRALAGRLSRREVASELEAQVGAVRAAGVTVDHLDSHQHVHLLPGVMAAIIRLAHRTGVDRLRSHAPLLIGHGSALGYYVRHPRRILTHAGKRMLTARLGRAGLRGPDGMVGPALLLERPPSGPLAEWAAILAGLPVGTWELVVHPAEVDGTSATDLARLGALVERRTAELGALTSPAFQSMVRAAQVTLVPFRAVERRLGPQPLVAAERRQDDARHAA